MKQIFLVFIVIASLSFTGCSDKNSTTTPDQNNTNMSENTASPQYIISGYWKVQSKQLDTGYYIVEFEDTNKMIEYFPQNNTFEKTYEIKADSPNNLTILTSNGTLINLQKIDNTNMNLIYDTVIEPASKLSKVDFNNLISELSKVNDKTVVYNSNYYQEYHKNYVKNEKTKINSNVKIEQNNTSIEQNNTNIEQNITNVEQNNNIEQNNTINNQNNTTEPGNTDDEENNDNTEQDNATDEDTQVSQEEAIQWSNADSSSILPSDASNYDPKNVLDDSIETAWCEGVDGPGINEWIVVSTNGEVDKVNSIGVINGFTKSELNYTSNNRVKKAELIFSDGSSMIAEFEDNILTEQVIDLDGKETSSIKIVILEVYAGSEYDDTCISSITVNN